MKRVFASHQGPRGAVEKGLKWVNSTSITTVGMGCAWGVDGGRRRLGAPRGESLAGSSFRGNATRD